MKRLGLFACAAACLATAAPALAQPVVERVTVPTRDLDLKTKQGVTTLKTRVNRAVRQVCGGAAFSLHDKVQQRGCMRTASRQASADIEAQIAKQRQIHWSSDAFRQTGRIR